MQIPSSLPSTQWMARGIVLIVVLTLLMPAVASAVTYKPTALQPGTISSPANGTTVISVQGFKIAGQQNEKKPARLVGVGPRGSVKWVYNGSPRGIVWFYDVDPTANGTLVITGTRPGKTIVTEWNPTTGKTLWSQSFHWEDTHDVDLINGDQLLVGNMRNYSESTGQNNDQVLIYDLSSEQIVWQWRFRKHGYSQTYGGKYTDDWTHVNDVDKINNGSYLVSVRNFDQVIRINRSTKRITLQLGKENQWNTLYEQHNPQFLTGKNETPTVLVADSENDRIVEYAKVNSSWNQTWRLEGGFSWPRDADRLPNGNTLITDSLNHRVLEVTPTGKIVWEFYAPWGTYEAERIQYGDEPDGPTIREQDATGNYTPSGSAALTPGTGEQLTFAEWLTTAFAGTPVQQEIEWFAERWAHITPWIRPVWMGPWEFIRVLLAGISLLVWFGAETIYHRNQILTTLTRHIS